MARSSTACATSRMLTRRSIDVFWIQRNASGSLRPCSLCSSPLAREQLAHLQPVTQRGHFRLERADLGEATVGHLDRGDEIGLGEGLDQVGHRAGVTGPFHEVALGSNTIKADVSYMIYLPPDYEQKKEARYPVLYQLPASGGTPRRDGPQVTGRIDKAIRANRINPMIVVAVNGLAGNTMYADTHDGLYPLRR